MLSGALLLLAVSSPPSPTPTPTPALVREKAATSRPTDLSSFAGRTKVDRGKADTLFRQEGAAPGETPPPSARPTPGASAGRPETASPASSSSEESGWRQRAESARRNLQSARDELAATERRLPQDASSSVGTPQRALLLSRYQQRVDRAQASLDALAEECRRSTGCQPGWIR